MATGVLMKPFVFSSFILQLFITDFLSMISSTVRALYALLRLKTKTASINARNMGLLV